MTNFTYNRDIPDTNNNPSVDQPNMKINTNSIDDIIDVDHFSFGENNGGMHRVIHSVDNVSDPAPVSGFGEYYAKTVGSNIEAFFQSATGIITQLTGPTAPSATSNGFVYLPGGIILQWGSSSSTSSPVTRSFPTPFLNNVFTIVGNLTVSSSTGHVATFYIRSNSLTDFTAIQADLSSSANGFYWIAIGN